MTKKKRMKSEDYNIEKLRRSELIHRVSQKTGFRQSDVKEVISAMEDVICSFLSKADYDNGREATVLFGMAVGAFVRKPMLYYDFKDRVTKESDYRIKIYADVADTLDRKIAKMWKERNEKLEAKEAEDTEGTEEVEETLNETECSDEENDVE